MLFVHDISPVLAQFGSVELRWYGLLFALGIVLNYLILTWIFKRENYPLKHLDSLVIYLFFGMVIGARLGHVFFYDAKYFLSNPVEILKIWNGGLASHGAATGLLVAYLLWTKFYKLKFTKFIDAVVVPMPLTAAFVRIGNFFNSEIVGTPVDGDWGVIFARLGEDFPRHPVQLYSAFMNLTVFVVLLFVYKKYYKKTPPLFLMFLYLLLYFGGRFIVEFWKDLHVLPISFPLSMGQVLSILPVLIAVIYFIFFFPKQKKRSA